MDALSANWFTELEMEDPTFIHRCQMQSLGGSLDEFDFESFSSDHVVSSPPSSCSPKSRSSSSSAADLSDSTIEKPPPKQLKSAAATGKFRPRSSSSSLISFGNFENPEAAVVDAVLNFYGNLKYCNRKPKDEPDSSSGHQGTLNFDPSLISHQDPNEVAACYRNKEYSTPHGRGTKRPIGSTRNPSQSREHVIAERKRRVKLNQRFIDLSAIVPGLKKTDKASVLGGAVKYLKELQERVKVLEEETAKKMVESVVSVKTTDLVLSDNVQETSSSHHNSSDSSSNQRVLEIEARVLLSNKDIVLVRIHCEKQVGVAAKILGEIERLHLTVISSSFMPFGECIVDMTVVAQMNSGFCTSAEDLVQNLRLAFLQ